MFLNCTRNVYNCIDACACVCVFMQVVGNCVTSKMKVVLLELAKSLHQKVSVLEPQGSVRVKVDLYPISRSRILVFEF
jgi:hypothetical protein